MQNPLLQSSVIHRLQSVASVPLCTDLVNWLATRLCHFLSDQTLNRLLSQGVMRICHCFQNINWMVIFLLNRQLVHNLTGKVQNGD